MIATLFVLSLCYWAVHLHTPLDVAYAIVVLVLIPPICLSWPESLIGVAIAGSATVAASLIEYGSTGLSATIPVVAAVLSGLIMLHLRIRAIDEHTSLVIALRRRPTTDPLTGLLAWGALATLAPNVFSLAESVEGEVHMIRIDIADLDKLRADYGPVYADQIIGLVGRSLGLVVQPGELLARRDDDSFAILGLGDRSEMELREDLEELLLQSQVSLGKRPVHLVVALECTHDASNYARASLANAYRRRRFGTATATTGDVTGISGIQTTNTSQPTYNGWPVRTIASCRSPARSRTADNERGLELPMGLHRAQLMMSLTAARGRLARRLVARVASLEVAVRRLACPANELGVDGWIR